jgi:lactate 2-monooxygenase
MNGLARQTSIYLGGVSGARPKVPLDFDRLEQEAEKVMRPEAFAYIKAGAGSEDTVAANRAGFGSWRIVPRMLRDVSERDTSVELFGQKLPSPFLTAPIGVLELAHRQADRAVAKAARQVGVPMIFSNQALTPMEETAELLGDTPYWFQLYWSKSNELVESFVARAEACGCRAIVVTLDTTILGWRPRDLTPAYLPFLRGKGIAQYTSDPVFRRLAEEGTEQGGAGDQRPRPTLAAVGTLIQLLRSGANRPQVQKFVETYSRPSLSWSDLPFLRERTRLPVLLKGILHPDDARRALDAGVDGIVVSNHGGRQVDGAIPTIDALPEVVHAVDGRVPVLLDSGIRGGADAFKALALGATAVLLGRPYVYGLALAGERGVREVLENHMADFDLTMGLAGCRSIAEIDRSALALRPA